MKRKKLPYSYRLIRVSLKWTWRALIMIVKVILTSDNPGKNRERQFR